MEVIWMFIIFFQVVVFGIFCELEEQKWKKMKKEIHVRYSNYKSMKNISHFKCINSICNVSIMELLSNLLRKTGENLSQKEIRLT